MSGKRSLVYGIGVNDWDGKVNVDGKLIWEYKLWKGMLQRSYDEKLKQKHPTYNDVTCSKEWLLMTNFVNDVSKMKGCGLEGWHLDKDVLVKGNKLYSKDTCCFVPQEINKLLIKSDNDRGEWPVGVCFHKVSGKFGAYLSINGKMKHLGYFTTAEEAFQVYKLAKEAYIKVVAQKWQHLLDERVFQALLTHEVTIND